MRIETTEDDLRILKKVSNDLTETPLDINNNPCYKTGLPQAIIVIISTDEEV